ncbi:MAG TPA: lasso peptide biosynthesis B2 protein [Acidimicrobiia bacterium]|nr:lasso peptide biosynthesis B2 protein [Acidimicrobiia bacterium]
MSISDSTRVQGTRPWTAAQIVWTTIRVRRLLRRNDLRTALAHCRPTDREATPAPSQDEIVHVGRAVRQIVGRLPGDSRPIVSSLVLIAVLARRGVDASLVIGVREGEAGDALAWVEIGDVPAVSVRGKFAQLVAL